MNELLNILRTLPLPLLNAGPVDGFDDLDFVHVTVAGNDTARTWRILRDAVAETQRWPVIIGGRASLEALRENVAFVSNHLNQVTGESRSLSGQVFKWLQESEQMPFEKWLENHRNPAWLAADYLRQAEEIEKIESGASLAKLYRQFAEEYKAREPEVFDPATCEWPDEEVTPVTEFSVLNDMSTLRFEHVDHGVIKHGPELFEEALILLLPTAAGWEAPAYLFFGGFNSCPFPDVHVAMAKWGHRRHGAQVAAISHDTIELECSRCPATREDALLIARDLRLYAEEVTVAAKTHGTLASALKNGSIWSCWWD